MEDHPVLIWGSFSFVVPVMMMMMMGQAAAVRSSVRYLCRSPYIDNQLILYPIALPLSLFESRRGWRRCMAWIILMYWGWRVMIELLRSKLKWTFG